MGLCASSMLRWNKANRRRRQQPEPTRRGTPKALFVVRNDDGRPSKPEAVVFHPPQGSARSALQPQKAGKAGSSRKPAEKRGCECYDCMDVLGGRRRLRGPPPPPLPRLPCGSARSVAVEPVVVTAAAGVTTRSSPVTRGATADGKKAAAAGAAEGCRTPMTPRRTPVWQRRILMGTRCELPRFSGVILYDEHGRPLQSGSQNRADHLMSRVSKYESKGKKKTARTTTTLRDLL